MSYSTPLTRALLYPPTTIAALVAVAAEEGIAPGLMLNGSGLDIFALDDGERLTSIGQFLTVCENALRLSSDRSLAWRVGARLHLSCDGVYGSMLRSCTSLRDYFRFATQYRWLAPTTVIVTAVERGDVLRIVVDDALDALPAALQVFVVELQVAREITRLDDVLGVRCRPTTIHFRESAGDRTELTYPADVMERRPAHADPFASKLLLSTCDDRLADIEASLGFAGQVYRTLRQLPDTCIGMKAVASQLRMTDRTLRRRLADEGTSYSTISHHVRYAEAARQLHRSGASIEQIAASVGFSDPANFRRAFIRWTSMSPAQFRRRPPR